MKEELEKLPHKTFKDTYGVLWFWYEWKPLNVWNKESGWSGFYEGLGLTECR